MKKHISPYRISVVLLFSLAFVPDSFSEKTTDSLTVPETRLSLNYVCNANDSVTLSATLSVKRDMTIKYLENASLFFYTSDGLNKRLAGQAKTDSEGNSKITISLSNLTGDQEDIIHYTVEFRATGIYPAATAEFNAKPASLKQSFIMEDSLRVLRISATEKSTTGKEIPVPQVTVNIYIPRLFSLLKIGEITLDDLGVGTMEFPKELIGDSLGNLTVISKIEEHDRFGTVQVMNSINWGIPKHYIYAEGPSRELWTPIAPLWMIITLVILLVGVWAHYIYAIYELVMIKRHNKKREAISPTV
ncbi:MAG: hypothetical protein PHP04_00275 [Bacteroidales bacterium]|nr:hypothetical protein [Bacteroidales bacterium]